MNYRKTKFYKSLTPYLAMASAEGFYEGKNVTQEETLIAWQWLVDNGTVWHLQRWFGRTAVFLIEQGLIKRK